MYKTSIIPTIIENYDHLTNVEKRIADYFIKNRHKEDFSSHAMKKKLFVSEASLSRFAKKCGFHGYREFIYRYEESFIDEQKDISFGFQEVLNTYHELLNQSVHYVDESQIERLCVMIQEARHILVLGIGSSGLVAKEMKNRFMRLGISMEAVDQGDEMRMQSVLQKENYLVIGMSLSGQKEDICFALKHAKDNGAKTVIMTANTTNVYHYCDEKITVPSFQNLDSGHMISPQFPLLVIVDVCYNYFFHHKGYQESHQKTVDIFKK